MSDHRSSYVNLEHLAEFNKYTAALGTAAFLYFDQYEAAFPNIRTLGALLSAIVVVIGILIMSVLGRIEGDDIHYEKEKDTNKIFLFKVVSRGLLLQLLILVAAICMAGWLSLAKIRGWT